MERQDPNPDWNIMDMRALAEKRRHRCGCNTGSCCAVVTFQLLVCSVASAGTLCGLQRRPQKGRRKMLVQQMFWQLPPTRLITAFLLILQQVLCSCHCRAHCQHLACLPCPCLLCALLEGYV
jgi:hypothetical protein